MVKIEKHNLTVRTVIIGMAIILAFLAVVNPETRGAVFINLTFLMIAFFVFNAPEYQDDLVGIKRKNILSSALLGALFVVGFFILTKIVPGLSLGYPTLPQQISDSLEAFFVILVAPIVEEIFFRGAVMAYFSNFDTTKKKKKIWIAIIVQAFLFSIFHVGAYIAGWYTYPDLIAGFTAINANLSAFITAFIFGILSGYFVTRNKVRNLIFSIIAHMGLNLIAYSLAIVVFL